MSRWSRGRITTLSTADGLPDDDIRALFVDPDGVLWIGTNRGLGRFDGAQLSAYTTADGLVHDSVRSLHGDHRGALWIGTEAGLSRMSEGRFESFTSADGLSHDRILALEEDHRGQLWIGTFGGLDRWTDAGFFSAPTAGLASPIVRALQVDVSGTLWIGTDGGLSRLRGTAPEIVPDQPDLVTRQRVWSLAPGPEGSLWIGTRSGGLVRMRERRIDGMGSAQGLADDLVWAIFEDRDGILWIGTNRGLTRIDHDGEVRQLGAGLTIRSLYQARDGTLLAGTMTQGPGIVEEGRLRLFEITEDPAHPRINVFKEDADGDLWIGSNGGLFRQREGRWQNEIERSGLASSIVRDLHLDRQEALWIASDGGLGRYQNGTFETFGLRHGLPVLSLTSIYEDDSGTFWIGTLGGGLVRLRDGVFTSFTVAEGFYDVFQTVEDDRGRLWMSNNRGLVSVEKNQLQSASPADGRGIPSITYGTRDGMPSRECNGGSQPAGWKTRDGRLWFPTLGGLAILDPEKIRTHSPSPRPVVEGVISGNQSLPLPADFGRPLEMSSRSRDLEVRYSAPSFHAPDSVHFRYRLEGFDEEWVDAGTRRSAFYTNLPPGRYELHLSARGPGSDWTESRRPLGLFLRPAFHQTPIFYGLCTLIAVAGLWAAHRLRVKTLLHRSHVRMLEARATEMERFAYTVSHDLKSPLMTIQGFLGFLRKDLEAGREERIERSIATIDKVARQMGLLLDELLELSHLGQTISRSERVSLAELAREAVDLVAGQIAEREVEIVIHDDLPVVRGDRRRLLQVLQNLLDNAVKFMGSQPRPRIEIGGSREKTRSLCSVRDNGIGIAPEAQEKVFGLFDRLDPATEGTGIGLALVDRIVRLHGGRVHVESDGAGEGSTFTFSIPHLHVDP